MKRSLLLTLCLGALSMAASAATLNFNFTSGGTNSGSGYGNVRTFTVGDVTITATAWGLTGNGYTTFETAQLGRFNTGLGSCNRGEGTGCDNPAHQFDNVGQYEFVLFQFSAPVDPLSVVIDPYGNYDRDVSYWTGNTAGLIMNGQTLAQVLAQGFGGQTDSTASHSDAARTVDLTSGVVNSLLFGPQFGAGDLDDRFKITSMSVDYTNTVPEPGSMALLGSGLLGLGFIARRRAVRK